MEGCPWSPQRLPDPGPELHLDTTLSGLMSVKTWRSQREGGGPRCGQGPKQPSASSPSEQRSMTGSHLGRAGLRGVEGHPSSSSVPTTVSPMYARVYMYL